MQTPNLDQPLTIVVFGVTGDLSRKKLLPALMDLFLNKGCIPENTRIVGFARQEQTTEEFREYVRSAIVEKGHEHNEQDVDAFLDTVRYCVGDFTQEDAYGTLAMFLDDLDKECGGCSNKLYYLAVQPTLYGTIFDNLSSSGLGTPCVDAWVRIAVEKPFGNDLEAARALDKKLCSLFAEEQVFRIDHYLAKQSVENILSFRFSNIIFEPIWCKEYIEEVRIVFHEDFGIGTRGRFYEEVGEFRNVGQNHMLQMLALVAMEDPGTLDADAIRSAREDVFGALKVLTPKEIRNDVVKGQYATYRTENNVASDSKTDTAFCVKTYVENERWKGVPFILDGVKNADEHRVEILIKFKKTESCICTLPEEDQPRKNKLYISMYPDESIQIKFWAKKPGFGMELEPRRFTFNYNDETEGKARDAYEKLLHDCIRGDQTLFTTGKEVELAWEFITPIVEEWKEWEPVIYKDKSGGPLEEIQ